MLYKIIISNMLHYTVLYLPYAVLYCTVYSTTCYVLIQSKGLQFTTFSQSITLSYATTVFFLTVDGSVFQKQLFVSIFLLSILFQSMRLLPYQIIDNPEEKTRIEAAGGWVHNR